MARIGMNPARNRITSYRPARVTVAILVYIPYLEGYFKARLDVLKLSLASLLRHTREPFDLLVFDNGSCDEVKVFIGALFEQGAIRYLMTSQENIGKIGALKMMFNAAPGEVIAYADDDIFYYPGWLGEHLKILDAFPRVGMVSGCAVRTLFDHGLQSNLRFAEEDGDTRLIRGQNIPEAWELEWAESYGRNPEEHLQRIREMEDIILERDGVRAFAIANHNQFVTPRSVILQFLPQEWSGRLMGEMYELDNAVDEGGYLRLSTIERTTRHLGNTVSEAMAEEARRLEVPLGDLKPASIGIPAPSLGQRFLALRPVRWFLQGLYNRLFWLLSQQSGGWMQTGKEG